MQLQSWRIVCFPCHDYALGPGIRPPKTVRKWPVDRLLLHSADMNCITCASSVPLALLRIYGS